MASPEELFTAVNNYRQANGKTILGGSGTLCGIAQARVAQQVQIGHLDHSGFTAAAQGQTEFRGLAEILQTNSKPYDATFLVQSGWGGSTSHNATMLDNQWTHGCGAVSGNYAVFIFGKK
jgi:uncharacterized protein YkwD